MPPKKRSILHFIAKIAEFIGTKPWVSVKFGLLFALVVGFAWYNFGNPALGLVLATLITGIAFANWRIFDSASDAFLDVQENDGAKEKGQKVTTTAIKRIFYACLDYGLAIVSIALVVGMKEKGFSFLQTVGVMWLLIDISSATATVWIYEKTGRDITLGRAGRRMVNAIMHHSRRAGIIAIVYECTLASFWSGPDYTVIFFRDELRTRTRLAVALILITAAHAFVWSAVYRLGYENIIDLIRFLFS